MIFIHRMKTSGIYKIYNLIDSKCYIGSSNNIVQRWYRHKSSLRKNNHWNPHLQNAWNKYGEESFDFVVAEECLEPNLLILEQKYLDVAKIEKEKYYNSSFDATKVEMTDDIRRKIGNSHRGKFGKLASHYGVYHTNETKKLISKRTTENTPRDKKHPNYDHSIHKFYNRKTNETFEGTQRELILRYNLRQSKVNCVVNKIRISHKNWILIG